MFVFDASSVIFAWDNYPIRQFPGLWKWMDNQIESGKFQLPQVAFDEVTHKTPECGRWLKSCDVTLLPTTSSALLEARRIKGLLGIREERYHPKGVDENDLLIIATARLNKFRLVSDEARQFYKQKDLTKRKIPAVCDMDEVEVQCMSFLELIKEADVVFR